jgi:hypothetical protein
MRVLALFLVACAASSAACEEGSPPARSAENIHAEYEARALALNKKWEAEIVWPRCENPAKSGRCGLVWDELRRGEYLKRFVRDRCHEKDPSAIASEACAKLFDAAFETTLRQWYPRAVALEVQQFCESRPDKCGSPGAYELQWLTSHDAHVNSYYGSLRGDLVREYEDTQQAESQARQADAEAAEERVGAVLRAIGGGLSAFGSASSSTAPPTSAGPSVSAPGSCVSDYECGGPGRVCVKPPGQVNGTCAEAVNKYGVTDFFRMPQPNSVGPGHAECSITTGCPISFQCVDGHCMRH